MQLPCNNRKTFWSNLIDWKYQTGLQNPKSFQSAGNHMRWQSGRTWLTNRCPRLWFYPRRGSCRAQKGKAPRKQHSFNTWLMWDLMCQNGNPRPEWPPWAEKVSPPEDGVVKLFPRPPLGSDRTPVGGACGAGLAAWWRSRAFHWTISSFTSPAAVVIRFSCSCIGLPNLCSWPDNSQTYNG